MISETCWELVRISFMASTDRSTVLPPASANSFRLAGQLIGLGGVYSNGFNRLSQIPDRSVHLLNSR